jgi:radical SAM superfamily enzyme YgiQ (UPF0313 family)
MMERKGLDFTWSSFANVKSISPALLAAARRAGCWQIGYGIESGNQEILDRICKGTTLDEIRQALRHTREAGIRSKGFFMIGNPGETLDTIRETMRFALELPLDDFQITNFTPFPGSRDFATAGRFGWLVRDWEKMNMLKISFIPRGLTADQILRHQKTAYFRFYLRPRIVLSYLAMAFSSPANFLKMCRGGIALMRMGAEGVRGLFGRLRRGRPGSGPEGAE